MIIVISGMRYKFFNTEYIGHSATTQINGIFVFLVFMSHFYGYLGSESNYSFFYSEFQKFFGQLVVTTFLFYSGYGIFISILRKGDNYINQLPIKIIELFSMFTVTVLIFYIIDLIVGAHYDFSYVLLSFIGWKSIGNSNWYMFDILLLYALTYLSYKMTRRHGAALGVLAVLSVISMLVLREYQEGARWYNTFLCYWAGGCYALYKDSYERFVMKDRLHYLLTTACWLALFLFLHHYRTHMSLYILHGIAFVMVINHVSMTIALHSKILQWLGAHIFGIYLLQRVPMILGSHFGMAQGGAMLTASYFFISLLVTLLLSVGFNQMTSLLGKYIFQPMKQRIRTKRS